MGGTPVPATPAVRQGQGDTTLSRAEFEKRFRVQFYDPAFDGLSAEIGRPRVLSDRARRHCWH
jgi:hypothetical protein